MAEKQEVNEEAADVKQNLLKMSEISLWIDTYDDIFSDFDPRPYSQRALSDDFLLEANKASRDKSSGTIELKFLVPKNLRKLEQEKLIKARLRDHFKRHAIEMQKEYKKVIREGAVFAITGVVLMFITTFLLVNLEKSTLLTFLSVLLEPAGWFLFWEGLNVAIFESRTKKPNLEFYDKMSKAEISFWEY